MQQVVFAEEVSLVATTGRRPSTLPTLTTHAYSISTVGTGTAAFQGHLLRLRLCSAGFQLAKGRAADLTIYPFCFQPYYVRLKTRKKNPKFRPWLM